MSLHFCHVCKEIRDTAEGFCVMCHTFLGPEHPTLKFHPDAFSIVMKPFTTEPARFPPTPYHYVTTGEDPDA